LVSERSRFSQLLDVRRPSFYLIAGCSPGVCVLKSGVHATLAGVAVGLAMPLTRRDGHSLLEDTNTRSGRG